MSDIETHGTFELFAKVEKKAEEFVELLSNIEYAPPEMKKLWRDVYENANEDRQKASLLFTELYGHVHNSPEMHAAQGKQLTQYLERMNKANDQLLKLAEIIANSANVSNEIDAEALYDEISGKKK